MALTQVQMVVAVANAQKVRIGGLAQLTVRVKPAQKARRGRNPATGEAITIARKPASVDVRARPLAHAKGALPSGVSSSRAQGGDDRAPPPRAPIGPPETCQRSGPGRGNDPGWATSPSIPTSGCISRIWDTGGPLQLTAERGPCGTSRRSGPGPVPSVSSRYLSRRCRALGAWRVLST